MGTRSAIGYLQPSCSVRAVYCHWDGHPDHQLPILEAKYNTLAKVKALIKPGSMSSLESKHTWDSESRDPQPLYHAERGHGDKPKTSGKAFDYWRDQDCEYMYVFDGTKWITYSLRDISPRLTKVSQLLNSLL
jgi:hypothetical protein